MSKISFKNNTLIINIQKTPKIILYVIYLITFLCFALPLMGIILTILFNGQLKFVLLFMLGIFFLIGFYLLRVSLWNTFGKEIFMFNKTTIKYTADYKWFKDKIKTIDNNNIKYSILDIGYEDENLGTLLISNENNEIQSVIKITKPELEQLIIDIKNNFKD